MHRISRKIIKAFRNGNKLFICGNGGSATQANHFAGELVGKFLKDRRALPAISLTANNAILTAVANDYGYENVFIRQLEALANPGDIVISLSTSGKSQNCIKALDWARNNGVRAIDFPRFGDLTPDIQEYQVKLMHRICEEVENEFS